jgi:F-type H+-transporting ATPase subunit epsilon
MAEEVLGKFQCVVLTPRATLLDCKTLSITLPAHDGQMGVWQDHMPMLCKLGLGIMEVRDFTTDDDQTPSRTYFLVDGGFARIINNVVTVLAYDVMTVADVETADAEKMRLEAEKISGDSASAMEQRKHDAKKAALVMQMAQISASQKKA